VGPLVVQHVRLALEYLAIRRRNQALSTRQWQASLPFRLQQLSLLLPQLAGGAPLHVFRMLSWLEKVQGLPSLR
jgi:hypothetical protein